MGRKTYRAYCVLAPVLLVALAAAAWLLRHQMTDPLRNEPGVLAAAPLLLLSAFVVAASFSTPRVAPATVIAIGCLVGATLEMTRGVVLAGQLLLTAAIAMAPVLIAHRLLRRPG